MKTAIRILALAALLVSAGAQANCRAGDAAKLGSDMGLARDQVAAMQTAQKERSNSDAFGKCITGITSIQVVPTFPSLMDIFDKAAKKMCTLASGAIPNGPIFVPGTGVPAATVETSQAPTLPVGASTSVSSPAPSNNFWSKIWQ